MTGRIHNTLLGASLHNFAVNKITNLIFGFTYDISKEIHEQG